MSSFWVSSSTCVSCSGVLLTVNALNQNDSSLAVYSHKGCLHIPNKILIWNFSRKSCAIWYLHLQLYAQLYVCIPLMCWKKLSLYTTNYL